MPAFCTQKLGLGFPVALINMPALSASTAGIARVNNRNRNSGLLGFVLDKGAKLTEAPIVQSVPLLFSGLNRLANMRQIFQRNRQTGAFGSRNDCLADTVILVLLKPFLLAAHLAETLLCSPRAYALQCRPTFGIVPALGFYLRAGVLVAHAVGGDVDHPQINPKHSARSQQLGVVEVAYASQIPLAAHKHQIDFALAVLQQFALVVAASIGDFLAPGHKPDRDNIIGAKSQDAVIVRLGGMLAKSALCILVNLVAVGYLGYAAYRYLSRNLELCAEVMVAKFVEIELPEHFGIPRLFGKPVTSLVASLKRRAEQDFLLFCRLQFDVGYKFHLSSIETVIYCCQAVKSSPSACPLSLPMRKRRGISRSAR